MKAGPVQRSSVREVPWNRQQRLSIATFCLVQQHSVLHRDRDFDPFEDILGLQVVHP